MKYRETLEGYCQKYTALDHPKVSKLYKSSKDIDIYADLNEKLPIKSGSYDIVIAIQVLEYIQNIDTFFSEIQRITKKGGTIIISSPFLYPLHDIPYDKNRLSEFFLVQKLSSEKLKKYKIFPQGNYFEVAALFGNVYFMKKIQSLIRAKKSMISIVTLILLCSLVLPFIVINNIAGDILTILFREKNEGNLYPINYLIVATK